jgi:hypothetical protein
VSLANRGPKALTCGDNCRKDRSRRLKRQKSEAGRIEQLTPEQRELTEITRGERDDVAHRIVQEELRPVVREAITEDVMRSIQEFVGLSPKAVKALTEDLESEDVTIRQRAYTLWAKLTIGHPALVTRDDDPNQKQLIVNFELPRPDDPEPIEAEVVPEAAANEGERACDLCGELRREEEFVDGSDRCRYCWEQQRAEVAAKFALDDAD